MIRKLLLCALALHVSTVFASGAGGWRQRRARTSVLNQLVPSLDERTRREVVHAKLTQFRALNQEMRDATLTDIATKVLEVTDRLLSHAGTNDLERTRQDLREFATHLLNAADVSATDPADRTGRVSAVMIGAGGTLGLMIVTNGWAAIHPFTPDVGTIVNWGTNIGVLVTSATGSFFYYNEPLKLNVRGSKLVSSLLPGDRSMELFWEKMNTLAKSFPQLAQPEKVTIESLKTAIERELPGVSFEQACTSALLASP